MGFFYSRHKINFRFFFINMVTFFQEYEHSSYVFMQDKNFHSFQNKNQLKKLLRQLNIMIHRLEQDGFLGGSESVQIVFLYCSYIYITSNFHLISRGVWESNSLVRPKKKYVCHPTVPNFCQRPYKFLHRIQITIFVVMFYLERLFPVLPIIIRKN